MAPIQQLAFAFAVALLPAVLAAPSVQVPFTADISSGRDTTEPSLKPPDVERYDGHELWRLDWSHLSDRERDTVYELLDLSVDVWKATKNTVDVLVKPFASQALHAVLPGNDGGMRMTRLVANVQDLVDGSDTPNPPADTPTGGWNVSSLNTSFHDAYQPIASMHEFGNALANQWPDIVTGLEFGATFEGRPLLGWSAHMASDNDRHLEFIIQSGQHAREWVGPASAFYFLHSLILDATADPSSRAALLLQTYTFTIVPNINPDGYEYSRRNSRMWKKNRQNVGGLLCKGIDLNRNWGYQFRASRLACSDTYSGQTALEAYETKAMANYLINGTNSGAPRHATLKAFVDLHSYGQLFMFPFAYSCSDFPPDAENLMEAGLGVAKAIRQIGGQGYQTGQACDLTYRATGDAVDYTYGVADVRWSYSAELRDTGTYGFMLPAHLIRPTGEDVSAGLRYLASFIYQTEIDV